MKLPEGWREVAFEDIAVIDSGQGAPQGEKWFNGCNVFVRAGDLNNLAEEKYVGDSCEKITNEAIREYNLKKYPAGSVVFPKSGMSIMTDNIGILKFDSYVVNHLAIIQPKDVKDTDYIFYFLKKVKTSTLSKNSAYPSIRISDIQKIKLLWPLTEVRKKIVSILEKAEQAKEMRKEADELTKDFLKSVFIEMFGDKSKIKEIELFQVTEIVMGQSPPGNSYNEKEKGTPFFQGKAEFTERYPIVKKWTTQPTKMAKPNSVLMSVRAPVGSVNICNVDCCIGRGLASIYPKKELKLEFLVSVLQVMEEKIANMGMGSTFKAINSDQLKTLKIPVPPIELQNKFASIVKEVEAMKEQQKHSKEHSDNLFNALMQKAFKGELI